MRRFLRFFMAFVFLGCFASFATAEMTGMSLQERIRQSDAVVIGEIIKSSDTGVIKEVGVEQWMAICHVERYIVGPKIHNPLVEEAKAVSLISISFDKIPMRAPRPIELKQGKRYLLFLKEIEPWTYKMITPHHGAFEAGQNYPVHDEQSQQYPSAVKMSFDEIVQRVTTPRNPVFQQIFKKVEKNQTLMLTISSDKGKYKVGEEIGLTLEFKNLGIQKLWLYTAIVPQLDLHLRLYQLDGEKRINITLPEKVAVIRQIIATLFTELSPEGVFSKELTLKDFSKELVLQKGIYEISLEYNLDAHSFKNPNMTPWVGRVFSNTIMIEVAE